MKTLYIVRHAKSSWEHEGIEDIDRPLKKRGINDAHLLSKFLSKNIDRPDVFVSSSANRALHTAVIFCENLEYPLSNLKIRRQLYSFSDGYLVKTVKALDDGFNSAIIFSHDHGINTFVN
jgi:phosphohistidine phosphatase